MMFVALVISILGTCLCQAPATMTRMTTATATTPAIPTTTTRTMEATGARPASLVWPRERDFVTVMQGGDLQTMVSISMAEGFSVPESGYISISLGDEENKELYMCPGMADSITSCPNQGKSMEKAVNLLVETFLGEQELCLRVYSHDHSLSSTHCSTLVGSPQFPGKRESARYFVDSMHEFSRPRSDSLAILWERMWQHLAIKGDACRVLQVTAGNAAEDSCFLEKHSLSGIEHGCQSSTLSISRLEEVLSSGIVETSGTSSQAQRDFPSVEAPRDSDVLFVLDMMESSSLTLINESIATILSHTSGTDAPRRPRALLLKLPATRPRHGLEHAVSQLWGAGYLSFAVSASRLVPVSDKMWVREAYEDTVVQDGPGSSVWFGAILASDPGHSGLMAAYNKSGMVIDCSPQRMFAFNARDGYEADDCPPIHGVFRSSRLRLFEDAIGTKPGFDLDQHSLLRFRHNVYSEAGEDGIIAHLIETLRVPDGTCFEFGAWDGMFASNCRHLIESGWNGIMVEADPVKFADLQRNYRNHPQVALVNAIVVAKGENSMQGISAAHSSTGGVNVLSIDVDGLDFELFSSLDETPDFRPEIIIAECNGFIRPDLKTILGDDLAHDNMQQSLHVFREKGRELGYELVCFTQNAIFVRNDLAKKLRESQGRIGERGVNRLYFEALLINWNDIIRNVRLTREGKPRQLVEAETKEFGSYIANVDLEELLRRARADEYERGAGDVK